MTRCIITKAGGSSACGGTISQIQDSENYICERCRRVCAPHELPFINRANAYDDMLAAKKEQARVSKSRGKVFS